MRECQHKQDHNLVPKLEVIVEGILVRSVMSHCDQSYKTQQDLQLELTKGVV